MAVEYETEVVALTQDEAKMKAYRAYMRGDRMAPHLVSTRACVTSAGERPSQTTTHTPAAGLSSWK
jgi:hypothetical protein